MRPFLALVTPLAGGHVDNSLPWPERPVDPGYGVEGPSPQPPVGIWPSPGRPTHPIAPGGFPGRPTHPIAPGGPPLGIWGGSAPPSVDNTLPPGSPGTPEHPIELPPDPEPGSPSNPIVIPGEPTHPIAGGIPKSVVIWVPGRGYVVVQPGGGGKPDQSLPGAPPTAQPKR